MFDIEYKGANAIIISTKKVIAIVDPKLSINGLKDLVVKDAVEMATESRFAINSKDAQLFIDGPGEYEIGELSIRGISAVRHIDTESDEKKSTIYQIAIGEVKTAVIGNIAPKLTDDQLEEIGVVDIVVIPVGGAGYTLDATSAASLIRQIGPKAVIPVHYADSSISYEVPQDKLEVFVKELGAPVETTSKYKVKGASSLPAVLTVIEVTRS